MTYTTDEKVRNLEHLDENIPSTTTMTEFLGYADTEIDTKAEGDVYLFTQKISITGKHRIIDLKYDYEEIKEVLINSVEFPEYSKDNLVTDGMVEATSDTVPDYWNELESSGDTLTWDSTYSYSLYHSLKIVKGGASESYWYSDDMLGPSEKRMYKGIARIKVDADSSGSTYLRLQFLNSSGSVLKNYDSAAVSIQITQPSSASVLTLVSDSADDTTQTVIIQGTVSGQETIETVKLNGTNDVPTTNSFSYIGAIAFDSEAAGSVTSKSNSEAVTNATFTAGQTEKEDWQETVVTGSAPNDTHATRIILRCTSATGSVWGDEFKVRERKWRPIIPKRVEFFDNFLKGDKIYITYKRTKSDDLVEIIATKITAIYCLAHITGATTRGRNYKEFKDDDYGGDAIGLRIDTLIEEINRHFRELNKDVSNTDFLMMDID